MGLMWSLPRGTCFSVAVSRPIRDINFLTRQVGLDRMDSNFWRISPNGSGSVGPVLERDRSCNPQTRKSVWVPTLTFVGSPPNPTPDKGRGGIGCPGGRIL